MKASVSHLQRGKNLTCSGLRYSGVTTCKVLSSRHVGDLSLKKGGGPTIQPCKLLPLSLSTSRQKIRLRNAMKNDGLGLAFPSILLALQSFVTPGRSFPSCSSSHAQSHRHVQDLGRSNDANGGTQICLTMTEEIERKNMEHRIFH